MTLTHVINAKKSQVIGTANAHLHVMRKGGELKLFAIKNGPQNDRMRLISKTTLMNQSVNEYKYKTLHISQLT
jgi:hypothetical protein